MRKRWIWESVRFIARIIREDVPRSVKGRSESNEIAFTPSKTAKFWSVALSAWRLYGFGPEQADMTPLKTSLPFDPKRAFVP
jgi:hypothetical protein